LLDSGRILPSCVYLKGEYGVKDTYCGVPASLGKDGVRKVIELKISDADLKALQKSAAGVKANIEKLGI